MQRLTIKIYGMVQGTFFRAGAKKKADELGLVGWIKNVSDGTVEALVEGEEEKVKEFMEWCKTGPEMAKVDRVEEEEKDIDNLEFTDFEVVYY